MYVTDDILPKVSEGSRGRKEEDAPDEVVFDRIDDSLKSFDANYYSRDKADIGATKVEKNQVSQSQMIEVLRRLFVAISVLICLGIFAAGAVIAAASWGRGDADIGIGMMLGSLFLGWFLKQSVDWMFLRT